MLTEEMLIKGGFTLIKPLDEENPFYIELKCNRCGKIKKMSVQQISVATEVRCTACDGEKLLIENLFKKYGRNPYKFLSFYKNNKEPMKVECVDCGNIFEITPTQMLFTKNYPEGVHPCRQCTRIRARIENAKKFYEEQNYHFGEIKYKIIDEGEFEGLTSNEEATIQCLKCGEIFKIAPIYLISSDDWYCPKCHPVKLSSIGETNIVIKNDVSITEDGVVKVELGSFLKGYFKKRKPKEKSLYEQIEDLI